MLVPVQAVAPQQDNQLVGLFMSQSVLDDLLIVIIDPLGEHFDHVTVLPLGLGSINLSEDWAG